MSYAVGARTDRGMQRTANEDAAAVLDLPGVDAAFVVADGMGGLQAGDVASQEAVRVVESALRESLAGVSDPAAVDFPAILDAAVRRANAAVFALTQRLREEMNAAAVTEDPTAARPGALGAKARPAFVNDAAPATALMGTTVVVGVVSGGRLHLAHAGDSRAYLMRGPELYRLTEDHSYVAERVRAGEITEEEARGSRFRNMITRAVGIDREIEPDLRSEVLRPGDTVLVCTDGLTGMLGDSDIANLLASPEYTGMPPEGVASALVDAANRRDSNDNVTAVVLRVAAGVPRTNGASASATAPAKPIAPARPTATATPGAVVDLDAPRRRRRSGEGRGAASPVLAVLATVGLLALVGAACLAVSSDLRKQASDALAAVGKKSVTGGKQVTRLIPKPLRDYSKLQYNPPEDYGVVLARGDLLAYSPRAGLYFVRPSTGQVLLVPNKVPESPTLVSGDDVITTEGVPVMAVRGIAVEPSPATVSPAPKSRVFTATDLQGNLYVSYAAAGQVIKYSTEGRKLAVIKGFTLPEAVAVDEQGNIYVVDDEHLRICRAVEGKPKAAASPAPARSPAAARGTGGGAR
jgi:protein phosphatase